MIYHAAHIADLLSGEDETLQSDPLVITPTPDLAKLRQWGAASVDLRLGTWFVSLRQARTTHLDVGDPAPTSQLTKTHYVPFGRKFQLHPRAFVLGVTLEWLRLPKIMAAYVIGKSSWGRRGLIIATATGVHPGFRGCLTLELSNVGEIPITISPGMEICQLFFHKVMLSNSAATDQSQLAGMRKPTLGDVRLDSIARQLAEAYQ